MVFVGAARPRPRTDPRHVRISSPADEMRLFPVFFARLHPNRETWDPASNGFRSWGTTIVVSVRGENFKSSSLRLTLKTMPPAQGQKSRKDRLDHLPADEASMAPDVFIALGTPRCLGPIALGSVASPGRLIMTDRKAFGDRAVRSRLRVVRQEGPPAPIARANPIDT